MKSIADIISRLPIEDKIRLEKKARDSKISIEEMAVSILRQGANTSLKRFSYTSAIACSFFALGC